MLTGSGGGLALSCAAVGRVSYGGLGTACGTSGATERGLSVTLIDNTRRTGFRPLGRISQARVDGARSRHTENATTTVFRSRTGTKTRSVEASRIAVKKPVFCGSMAYYANFLYH